MEITRIKLSDTEISFIKERIGKIKAIIIGTIEFNIIITDSEDKNKYIAFNHQGNEVEIENLDKLIDKLNK